MIYYSDNDVSDPNNLLADTGFPSNINSGTVIAGGVEVGPETGPNGFTWQPGAAYPANNVYIAESDPGSIPMPEPATLALFGSGLLAFGLIGRRRKRPAQAA
jgi:hypothetical protein